MNIRIESEIKKWGNGSGIRLNKDILLTSGMKENEAIEIMAEPDKIVIVKRKQQSLVEQLENYKGFYNATNEDKEWLESEPTGGELW